MSALQETDRIVIDGMASRLAFRIGQAVEQLLVDRAIQTAMNEKGPEGEVIVTADHLRCALDASFLQEACCRIGVACDAETKERHSRPAA